jgi:hypothetical protein
MSIPSKAQNSHLKLQQVKGYMWVAVWYFMFCFDQVRVAID